MKTTLTIKTDKKLRDDAKRVAAKLGIPLTTVVNAKLQEFVREGRFEVSLAPRPERIKEWERMSRELDEHPEHETVLRSSADARKHFSQAWKDAS